MSCVGCNAGLMLAMVLVGMSSLVWMIVLSGVMLTYRLAPVSMLRWSQLTLSSALIAVGLVYMVGA